MSEPPTATVDFINPCLNFQRTDRELEMFFIFSIAVAGKSARPTEKAVKKLIGRAKWPCQKLARLWRRNELQEKLEESRIGKHQTMHELASWIYGPSQASLTRTLRLCGVDRMALEIPGVGPKTARFFALYSRPAQSFAVLDRHVLAWLRDRGHDAPVNTPQKPKRYKELEQIVLDICRDELIAPADLDERIWQERRR
jgi:thermostable 8-oxoguanine DNA glycosylase